MEDYNKIIESLSVKYQKSRIVKIHRHFKLNNFRDIENSLILVNRGLVRYGHYLDEVNEGELLFIPAKASVNLVYGSSINPVTLTYEDYLNNTEKVYELVFDSNELNEETEHYMLVTFDVKLFDSVNFFANLDIPPFVISQQPELAQLIKQLVEEENHTQPGKERMIKNLTDQIVVGILRYLLEKKMFVEQLATNSTYFKDPRLLNIFTYIRENIGEDLSNKVLAKVADVSEDYVGQYFKMLTGINPQDYIEYQRMEQAVNLLRTSKKSIKDIGNDIGYRDTAYFCRRFKMMFGIPAGKMRQRENLMSM
jgi:AraC-like DNA-binding protein